MSRKRKLAECVFCNWRKPIAAKGLCAACYSRQQKTGSLEYKRVKNTCSVDGCDSSVVSNGLCDKHRKRASRNGALNVTRPDDWGMREKHPLYTYWNDVRRRESLNISVQFKADFWHFVECVSPRPSKNHYIRCLDIDKPISSTNWQWVEGLTKANRAIASRAKRIAEDKKRLRLSAEERDKIILDADCKCQICGAEKNNNACSVTGANGTKSLCVDHCHESGEIRGVLCHSCNVALGHFKDDISLLQKAIVYLKGDKSP